MKLDLEAIGITDSEKVSVSEMDVFEAMDFITELTRETDAIDTMMGLERLADMIEKHGLEGGLGDAYSEVLTGLGCADASAEDVVSRIREVVTSEEVVTEAVFLGIYVGAIIALIVAINRAQKAFELRRRVVEAGLIDATVISEINEKINIGKVKWKMYKAADVKAMLTASSDVISKLGSMNYTKPYSLSELQGMLKELSIGVFTTDGIFVKAVKYQRYTKDIGDLGWNGAAVAASFDTVKGTLSDRSQVFKNAVKASKMYGAKEQLLAFFKKDKKFLDKIADDKDMKAKAKLIRILISNAIEIEVSAFSSVMKVAKLSKTFKSNIKNVKIKTFD